MAPWFEDKGTAPGIRCWQGRLVALVMVVVAAGAAVAATRLSDLGRWMPLIVIVLTVAGTIVLLSVTREGGSR